MGWMTTAAVAVKTGLTPDAVRWNERQGYLPAIKIPRGKGADMRLYEEAEVDRFIAARLHPERRGRLQRVRVATQVHDSGRDGRFARIPCPVCLRLFRRRRANAKYCSSPCARVQAARNVYARKKAAAAAMQAE
jgi:hypothetical protein